MTGKVFVDSIVLVYAHDGDAGTRQKRAADLMRVLWGVAGIKVVNLFK